MAMKGVKAVRAEMRRIEVAEAFATKAGIKRAQTRIKTEVRRDLRGAPRWGHRGKGVYDAPVDLGFHNHPRSGPIGKFTGDYLRGVGGKKRILMEADGMYVGGVGIGGKKIPQNNFKRQWEAKYPTFAPAVDRVSGELLSYYAFAWSKAWNKKGF
jgi:hypothetical protein